MDSGEDNPDSSGLRKNENGVVDEAGSRLMDDEGKGVEEADPSGSIVVERPSTEKDLCEDIGQDVEMSVGDDVGIDQRRSSRSEVAEMMMDDGKADVENVEGTDESDSDDAPIDPNMPSTSSGLGRRRVCFRRKVQVDVHSYELARRNKTPGVYVGSKIGETTQNLRKPEPERYKLPRGISSSQVGDLIDEFKTQDDFKSKTKDIPDFSAPSPHQRGCGAECGEMGCTDACFCKQNDLFCLRKNGCKCNFRNCKNRKIPRNPAIAAEKVKSANLELDALSMSEMSTIKSVTSSEIVTRRQRLFDMDGTIDSEEAERSLEIGEDMEEDDIEPSTSAAGFEDDDALPLGDMEMSVATVTRMDLPAQIETAVVDAENSEQIVMNGSESVEDVREDIDSKDNDESGKIQNIESVEEGLNSNIMDVDIAEKEADPEVGKKIDGNDDDQIMDEGVSSPITRQNDDDKDEKECEKEADDAQSIRYANCHVETSVEVQDDLGSIMKDLIDVVSAGEVLEEKKDENGTPGKAPIRDAGNIVNVSTSNDQLVNVPNEQPELIRNPDDVAIHQYVPSSSRIARKRVLPEQLEYQSKRRKIVHRMYRRRTIARFRMMHDHQIAVNAPLVEEEGNERWDDVEREELELTRSESSFADDSDIPNEAQNDELDDIEDGQIADEADENSENGDSDESDGSRIDDDEEGNESEDEVLETSGEEIVESGEDEANIGEVVEAIVREVELDAGNVEQMDGDGSDENDGEAANETELNEGHHHEVDTNVEGGAKGIEKPAIEQIKTDGNVGAGVDAPIAERADTGEDDSDSIDDEEASEVQNISMEDEPTMEDPVETIETIENVENDDESDNGGSGGPDENVIEDMEEEVDSDQDEEMEAEAEAQDQVEDVVIGRNVDQMAENGNNYQMDNMDVGQGADVAMEFDEAEEIDIDGMNGRIADDGMADFNNNVDEQVEADGMGRDDENDVIDDQNNEDDNMEDDDNGNDENEVRNVIMVMRRSTRYKRKIERFGYAASWIPLRRRYSNKVPNPTPRVRQPRPAPIPTPPVVHLPRPIPFGARFLPVLAAPPPPPQIPVAIPIGNLAMLKDEVVLLEAQMEQYDYGVLKLDMVLRVRRIKTTITRLEKKSQVSDDELEKLRRAIGNVANML